ncbi:MAG: NfeD family protein [Proteobacteria bacterium]|jgi:membrane protein implicated in regulation of membrane protease activity|nr:NfeD family protein [Pseudomonadota bacterium]
MDAYWIWWIAAIVLVGAELATGTFYLLAIGIAFALGGVSAWLGATESTQLLLAGALSIAGLIAAHLWRRRHLESGAMPALDVGQAVRIRAWKPDGSARVEYRGTQWDGVLATPDTPRSATMYIVGTRGSILVLGAVPP